MQWSVANLPTEVFVPPRLETGVEDRRGEGLRRAEGIKPPGGGCQATHGQWPSL